ncbi:MAG TPA: hypothetical protein VFZ31_00865 [Vicinamibacterales bacterium]
MRGRSFLLGLVLVMAAINLAAEQIRPLAPTPPVGQRVAPFFDGFYENADGSFTLSFGYSNLNATDVVEIPLGPNNFIEPKQFDGRQPTSFPPTQGPGPTGARRDRERGVFTVTIPPAFTGDVVWTLRHAGQTHKVPGRTKTGAYGLRWPMAMGSIPPLVGFTASTMTGRGPSGIESAPMQANVGVPLSITIWTKDDSERDAAAEGGVQFKARGPARPALNIKWYKHSGPGPVTFDPATAGLNALEGSSSSKATFTQPGSYMLRVRVDNFGRPDTSAGNQCCWTNGYVRVTVK